MSKQWVIKTSVYPLHHMQVLKLDEVIAHISPSPAHFTPVWVFALPCPAPCDATPTGYNGLFPPRGDPFSVFHVREIVLSVCLLGFNVVLPSTFTSKLWFFVHTCLPFPGMVIIYINIYKYFFYVCKYFLYIFFLVKWFFGSGFKTCMWTHWAIRTELLGKSRKQRKVSDIWNTPK